MDEKTEARKPVKKRKQPKYDYKVNYRNGDAMIYLPISPEGYTMGRAARRALERIKKRENRRKK